MANETLNPNRQGPENYTTLGDAVGTMLRNAAMNSDVCIPCKVVSYDRDKNVAVVHPLIKVVLTNETVSRSEIGPVPVFALGSKKYVINFPLEAGDTGWLISNDRDITKFLETLEEAEPATYRLHDSNDGVFYPDMIRGYTINSNDVNSVVLQSRDGSAALSLGPNQLFLRHTVGVTLDTPGATITGAAHAESLTAETGITTTAVDANGKILNFVGGVLIGAS